MTDIWKIGQSMKADEYYKKSPILNGNICGNEIMKANYMEKICNQMAESYDEIIDEQNAYLQEIELNIEEINKLNQEFETKSNNLTKRRDELLIKSEDGTITDEEKKELESISTDLVQTESSKESTIEEKNSDINTSANTAKTLLSKSEIATDYANTAIEKGEPLANTKDKKKSFWRKCFGGWNKSKEREAGNKLLDAGNNLLGQVNTSTEINKTISSKTKKKA